MSRRNFEHQNSKEVKYYGFMMLISFLVLTILKRTLAVDSVSITKFLYGFAALLFVFSSFLTIFKYRKSRKEPRNKHTSAGRFLVVLAGLFWILLLLNLSKEVLEIFSSLS